MEEIIVMKLSELFSSWENIRSEMVEAVKLLTQDQLDWLPEGGINSIADLLRHISETELWWFGNVIMRLHNYRDLTGEMAPDIESILGELEKSHKEYVLEVLKSNTIDDLDTKFSIPEYDKDISLNDIAWHVYEHEARHRGQIFTLMRLQGIKPPSV
jgi:uncharacterized damage-inducible protein DinB